MQDQDPESSLSQEQLPHYLLLRHLSLALTRYHADTFRILECLGSWQCSVGKMCKDDKWIARKESHLRIPTEDLRSETVLSETPGRGPGLRKS